MDDLILNLLKENGRVIIPDFGAFIVKQKSPLKVIFNEFLQYNDGALIGAVASQEKIDKDKAAAKVKELTQNYSTSLNGGKSVNIEGIGALVKTPTGKITLNSDKTTELQSNTSKTKEETQKIESKPESSPKTVEFDVSEKKETVKTPEPPKKEIPKPIPPKVEQKPVSTIPKPAEKQPIPKPAPSTSYNKPASSSTIPKPATQQPVSKPKEQPIVTYYNEEPSRSKTKIFVWVLIIIIVNTGLVLGYLYRDELKIYMNKLSSDKQVESENITTESDNTIAEPSDVEQVTEEVVASNTEPVIEEETKSVTESVVEEKPEMLVGTKYYVVAGVFRDESNADKLVNELKNKGFNADKFGKIGKMYAVSYDVFPSKSEADRLLLKIKREQNSGAWIKIID